MPTVDSKGRIVLPKEVRERLGIGPGSEVEIHEEDGKVVIEPEDGPERIVERMDQLVEETASSRGERAPFDDDIHPVARMHGDVIRRGASQTTDE